MVGLVGLVMHFLPTSEFSPTTDDTTTDAGVVRRVVRRNAKSHKRDATAQPPPPAQPSVNRAAPTRPAMQLSALVPR